MVWERASAVLSTRSRPRRWPRVNNGTVGGGSRSEGSFGAGGSSEQRKLSAAAEKHRAAEKKRQVANKKIMWKMEMPAILEEGSLDKPSGISDLLTVRSLSLLPCAAM